MDQVVIWMATLYHRSATNLIWKGEWSASPQNVIEKSTLVHFVTSRHVKETIMQKIRSIQVICT